MADETSSTPLQRLQATLAIPFPEINGVSTRPGNHTSTAFDRYRAETQGEKLLDHLVKNVLPEAAELLEDKLSDLGWIPPVKGDIQLEGDHVLIVITNKNPADEDFTEIHVDLTAKDWEGDWSVDLYLEESGTSTRGYQRENDFPTGGRLVGHNSLNLVFLIEEPGFPCTIEFGLPVVEIQPTRIPVPASQEVNPFAFG